MTKRFLKVPKDPADKSKGYKFVVKENGTGFYDVPVKEEPKTLVQLDNFVFWETSATNIVRVNN